MPPTPHQTSAATFIARYGRTFKLHTGQGLQGVERRFTGEEDGFEPVKGIYKERPYEVPMGEVERRRGEADTARSETLERTIKIAATSVAAEPTTKGRAVDGAKTYAIERVETTWRGETPIIYTLFVRPV